MTNRLLPACCAVVMSAGLLTGAVPDAAAATSTPFTPPRPKLLATVPGPIVGFAQHRDYVVWGNGAAKCGRIVQLRKLSTGTSRFLDSHRGPMCDAVEYGGMQHDMALSGTRALWAYVNSTLSQDHFQFFAAAPGGGEHRVLGFSVDHDDPLAGPTPLAGGSAGLFIANGAGTFGEDGGADASVYRVGGAGARPLGGTGHVFDVAASAGRIALAQRIPGGCVCNFAPEWSPDGRQIAFISARAEGRTSQLFVMDADGGGARALVDGVRNFEWSPDGERIAAATTAGLVVVGVDGRGRRTISPLVGEYLWGFAWSPDGRLLAYQGQTGRETTGLYVGPAAGGTPVRLGPGGYGLSWSPDSSRIAHDVDSGDVTHVQIVSVSGTPVVDLGPGYSPSWSPDGGVVAYLEPDRVLVAAPDGSGSPRVAVSFATDDIMGVPTWSPNGRWLAFVRDGTDSAGVWLVRPDGTDRRRLAPRGSVISWSPDSTTIAFTTNPSGVDVHISVVDVASGAPRQLVSLRSPGRESLSYSPDGTRLLFHTNEIAVVDAGGGSPTLLTRTVPDPERVAVETRRPDGRRITSFNGPAGLRGLALGGARVALVVHRSRTRATIEIRTATGKLQRRMSVPRPAWNQISMSGRWVVFTAVDGQGLRSVHLLDADSGKTWVLARSRVVVGLSIDGRRVAWAEQGSPSRIRAVVLPKG